MGSNGDPMDTTIDKPFSIRDYVVANREKDISCNWPFPEKYLQLCLAHGVSEVLPPFQCRNCVRNASYKEATCRDCSKEADNARVDSSLANCVKVNSEKQETVGICNDISIDEAVSEFSNRMCVLSLSTDRNVHVDESRLKSNGVKVTPTNIEQNTNSPMDEPLAEIPRTKKLIKNKKRRRGKPKAKKRLMVDIFAKARPCTLEQLAMIAEMNRVIRQQSVVVPAGCGDEGVITIKQCIDEASGSMGAADGNSKPTAEERICRQVNENENHEIHVDKAVCKKQPVLKVKFRGGRFKSHSSRVISGNVVKERKVHEMSEAISWEKCSLATRSDYQHPFQNGGGHRASVVSYPKASVNASRQLAREAVNTVDANRLEQLVGRKLHPPATSDQNHMDKNRKQRGTRSNDRSISRLLPVHSSVYVVSRQAQQKTGQS